MTEFKVLSYPFTGMLIKMIFLLRLNELNCYFRNVVFLQYEEHFNQCYRTIRFLYFTIGRCKINRICWKKKVVAALRLNMARRSRITAIFCMPSVSAHTFYVVLHHFSSAIQPFLLPKRVSSIGNHHFNKNVDQTFTGMV